MIRHDISSLFYVFQSTRPYGARPLSCWRSCFSLSRFNPRARTGRDHRRLQPDLRSNKWFQSTRPYRARPESGYAAHDEDVSIHAPVQGATRSRLSRRIISIRFNPRARTGRDRSHGIRSCIIVVSIHAPVQGATGCKLIRLRSIRCFNPRARTGRDCSN